MGKRSVIAGMGVLIFLSGCGFWLADQASGQDSGSVIAVPTGSSSLCWPCAAWGPNSGRRARRDPNRRRQQLALSHEVIPDRIEAGTLLVAGALPGCDVVVHGCLADHMEALLEKLRAAGAMIEAVPGGLRVIGDGRPRPVDVRTAPFPGFTDMQAQLMVLLAVADGSSMVIENVFENRFMHVQELQRLGAQIAIDGKTALIKSIAALSGAPVMASNLRASAALVLAGLLARGSTEVLRVYHLDRGYERLEEKSSWRPWERASGGSRRQAEDQRCGPTAIGRARPGAHHGGRPRGAAAGGVLGAVREGGGGLAPGAAARHAQAGRRRPRGGAARFIGIRAADVASYVEHGAAELGIAGLDVLREEPRDLYEPLDLGIGQLLNHRGAQEGRPAAQGVAPRVATKYVTLAARHFAQKSLPAEIIELHGSIEVAPSLGLYDLIVDITETGETLRANGLSVEETVLEVSARLIVNRVALKLHGERLRRLIAALRAVTGQGNGQTG